MEDCILYKVIYFCRKVSISSYYLDVSLDLYSAGVYLIGCVIYWFWVSGEVQPWAETNSASKCSSGEQDKNGKNFAFSNDGLEMKE